MTLDDFRTMVNQHDLTYSYSDDAEVSRRGYNSFRDIQVASYQFDPSVAETIWNEVVDRKLGEKYRKEFYWRTPRKVT